MDETAAIRHFQGGRGLAGLPGQLLRGPLCKVAFVEVPYRVFAIEATNGVRPLLAFDLFTGTLDAYTLDSSTEFEESPATDRNHLPVRLDAERALKSARERYQRIRFQEGFFKSGTKSASLAALADLYVPYWVGFFGRERRLSLRVLNAARCAPEGARLRHAIRSWITERQGPN